MVISKANIFKAEMINGDSIKKVVLKKIKGISDDEDVAKHALRELSILSFIQNLRIIKLLDVVIPKQENLDYLYFVTEEKLGSLNKLMNNLVKDDKYENYIRFIIHQILIALKYLHSLKIIHRDIKPSNILIDSNSLIYICDFELARSIKEIKTPEKGRFITKNIGTLYYAAPEMLGNEENGGYNEKVDIWSVGCIMAELYTGKSPFFKDEKLQNDSNKWNWFEQLKKIFSVFGRPEKNIIEKVFKNKEINDNIIKNIKEKDYPRKDFSEIFPEIKDKNALDLLQKLFKFDYKERISAEDALKHPFFEEIKFKDKKRKIKEFTNEENEVMFDYFKEIEENNETEIKPFNYKINVKKDQIKYCQIEIEKCYQKFLEEKK